MLGRWKRLEEQREPLGAKTVRETGPVLSPRMNQPCQSLDFSPVKLDVR